MTQRLSKHKNGLYMFFKHDLVLFPREKPCEDGVLYNLFIILADWGMNNMTVVLEELFGIDVSCSEIKEI